MGFIKLKFEKDKEDRPIKTVKLGKEKKKGKEIKKPKVKPRAQKSFVLDWEAELGYSENPFKSKILTPVSDYFVGYEKERNKTNLFIINNEKFGIISGQDGVGKTILLRWLYEQLQQYKDKILVLFLNGKVLSQEFILVKSMVNPLLSIYEKKIKKVNKDVNIERNLSVLKRKLGSKKLILLIDDVEIIPSRVLFLLKKIYSVMPLQIIMACNNQVAQKLRAEDWLKDRLKIQLKGLGVSETRAMIGKRIKNFGGEDIFPFDDSYIRKICKNAAYNPKQILVLCQHYAIELAVKQLKRKTPKETTVVKEEVKEQEGVREEQKERGESVVPVLKELPRTKEYRIRVESHGSEAISMDDLKKDEKGNYKVKGVEKK